MKIKRSTKKRIALLLVVSFLLQLGAPIAAASSYGAATPSSQQYVDEDGYQVITTAEELDGVRKNPAGKYRLGGNIDLTAYVSGTCTLQNGWYPIGYGTPFTGVFDGNGYTISGLWSGSGWGIGYKGLFSVLSGATVKDLNIELSAKGITGIYEIGGLAGVAKDGTAIENCTVSGGAITVTGGGYAGGLVGYVYGSPGVVIRDSHALDTIIQTSGNYGGGLVGAMKDKAAIMDCSASGNVTSFSYPGGLVGAMYGASSITGGAAMGDVVARASYAGGLVGAQYGGATVTESFATGNVTANHYGGGLVGVLYEKSMITKSFATGSVTVENYIAGGLVGEAVASTIENCYAWGDVKGTTGVGGLVGYFSGNGADGNKSVYNAYSSGAVSGRGTEEFGAFNGRSGVTYKGTNYFDENTSGLSRGYGSAGNPKGDSQSYPQGRSTWAMMKQDTFVDWDFETIWKIDEDETYPYFLWWYKKYGPGELDLRIEGEQKQNRKLTISGASDSGRVEDYEKLVAGKVVTMTILPVDKDISPQVIRIDEDASTADYKELIVKQAGEYEVTLFLDGEAAVITTVYIAVDEDPLAAFIPDETAYYRDENGTAKITVTDGSYSPDGDEIGKWEWVLIHDQNNNGSYADDEETVLEAGPDQTFAVSDVGHYQVRLKVTEIYENTIPKFLTEEDYLSAVSEPVVIEVKNRAPSVKGSVEKAKSLDLVATFGTISDTRREAIEEGLKKTQEILEDRGVSVRLGGVGSHLYTAIDTFDWDIYEHENYRSSYIGTREHSIIWEGDDIRMLGYNYEAYKDFLFLPDNYYGEKILSFDLIRDRTDWHSMEGGGFLFNTTIEDDTIEGYSVLITSAGLKLVQINKVNLTSFRNGYYTSVQNAGKLLTTATLKDPYARHSLKIVANPTSVSVWDNDELIIDNYQLPAASRSYGFGPIISHASHSCSQLSYFTFSNILMESDQSLTLADALHNYEWNASGTRALVHVSDGEIEDFAVEEGVPRTAETVLKKSLYYAAAGTGKSEDEFTLMLQNVIEGSYLDSGDVDLFAHELADVLWAKIQRDVRQNPGVFTIDDELDYPYDFADPEGDPLLEEAFLYEHDPEVFTINTGLLEGSGVYGGRKTTLPKVGTYRVLMKASDAPSTYAELLDDYHLWSEETVLAESILVNQRPVALLQGSVCGDSGSYTHADLQLEASAYDPDHSDEADLGIAGHEWRWKRLSDAEWTEEEVPERLPYEDEYLIYYRVLDREGLYSHPAVVYVSTLGMAPEIDEEPPEISLSIEKIVWEQGETVIFEASAVDNYEVEFFEVYVDGQLLSTSYGRQIFTAGRLGEVVIEVVAKDYAGNESRQSLTITVVPVDNEAPSITLHQPANGDHITEKTDIIATITDNVKLVSYKLEYRKEGTEAFTLLNSGTEPVLRETIGMVSPAQMEEGLYEYKITAEDLVGNTAWITFFIRIDHSVPDDQAPTVEIHAPANNEMVSGIVEVIATVTDETALESYELTLIGPDDEENRWILAEGYSDVEEAKIADWDTTQFADGVYRLELLGTDKAGNYRGQGIYLYVKNTEDDNEAPHVEFLSPVHGEVVEGVVPIRVTVTDNKSVESYELSMKPATAEEYETIASGSGELSDEILLEWDTTLVSDGTYALSLMAKDDSGNHAGLIIYVVVKNGQDPVDDRIPPVAVIESPKNGDTISGKVEITGTALDETELDGYQLEYRQYSEPEEKDWILLATSSHPVESGYLARWDTGELEEGVYQLRLTAYDLAANSAHHTIHVTVEEEGSDPGPGPGPGPDPDGDDFVRPEVKITMEHTVLQLGSTAVIQVVAEDNSGVKDLSVYINGVKYENGDHQLADLLLSQSHMISEEDEESTTEETTDGADDGRTADGDDPEREDDAANDSKDKAAEKETGDQTSDGEGKENDEASKEKEDSEKGLDSSVIPEEILEEISTLVKGYFSTDYRLPRTELENRFAVFETNSAVMLPMITDQEPVVFGWQSEEEEKDKTEEKGSSESSGDEHDSDSGDADGSGGKEPEEGGTSQGSDEEDGQSDEGKLPDQEESEENGGNNSGDNDGDTDSDSDQEVIEEEDGELEPTAELVEMDLLSHSGITIEGEGNQRRILLTPEAAGKYEIRIVAADYAGNKGEAAAELRIVDPDASMEIISEMRYEEGLKVISRPTSIYGTAAGAGFSDYVLKIAPQGTEHYRILSESKEPVVDGVLGVIDTTLLQNGQYDVMLVVYSESGAWRSYKEKYVVEGDLKIGDFSLTFEDMVLAVNTLPISVYRTYDSRMKEVPSDFGFGWSLSTSTIELTKNHGFGEGWEQRSSGGFLPTYYMVETEVHDVVVRYPNGEVDIFQAKLSPEQQQYVPLSVARVVFEPKYGSTSKLELLNQQELLVNGGVGGIQLYTYGGMLFDSNDFQLTTKTGVKYRFNSGGLFEIEDQSGNVIKVDKNGYHHSDGRSIVFQRDQENRIVRIQEEDNYFLYSYDSYGDLYKVTDANGNETHFIYDAAHNLTDVVDPRGIFATKNEYDEEGRHVASIDADGNRIEFNHDLASLTTAVRDRRGYQTVYAYDEKGNVISITDPLGYSETNKYGDHGKRTEHRDKNGNVIQFSYDEQDQLVEVITATGRTDSIVYDSQGRIVTMRDLEKDVLNATFDDKGRRDSYTDANGNVKEYSYYDHGLPKSISDEIGTLWNYTYDKDGNAKTVVDGSGRRMTLDYDSNNRNISKTIYRSTESGTVSITEFYTYDSMGNLIEVKDSTGAVRKAEYNEIGKIGAITDELGNRTRFSYDRMGRLERVLYPDGTTEQFSYDASDNMTVSMDRLGRTTTYEYDPLDRLVKTTYANGGTVSYVYDANGNVISVDNPLGGVTEYEYNGNNQNIAIVDPFGNRMQFTYDNVGQLAGMTDPKGNEIRFTYDNNRNHTGTIFEDGTSITAEYDSRNRIVKETNQEGHSIHYTYNNSNVLTGITDALGGTWNYAYDEQSNLTKITDPNGNSTRYEYDTESRLTKVIRPMGMESTIAYDAKGQMVLHTDFAGNVTRYTYDAMGRMIEKENPDDTILYHYTDNGQLEEVKAKNGITKFEYDSVDGLVSRQNPDGSSVHYTYDKAMNPTTIKAVTPNGLEIATNYEYDVMNRIRRIVERDGTATVYEYDANGNRSVVRHANGVVVSYEYDSLNRLIKQKTDGVAGGPLLYEYVLSPSGQRIEVTEAGKSTTYTYDALARLVKEEIVISDPEIRDSVLNEVRETFGDDGYLQIEYGYDGVGNRLYKIENGTRTDYTYDANDRLLTAGDISYGYDRNGNQVGQSGPGKTAVYEFDADNRLRKARMEEGADLIIETYEYDVFGRRIQKTTNEVYEVHYVVDDMENSRILLELDETGEILAEYVHSTELLTMNRNGVKSTYGYDGQSNIRLLFDDAGNITDTYGFDAFGNLIQKTGISKNDFLYRGEYLDANTGFYQLRARYMDPSTGRFISTDPYAGSIYDPVSLHRYLYANANPVMYSDPSGMNSAVEVNAAVVIQGILNKIATLNLQPIFNVVFAVVSPYIAEAVCELLLNPSWGDARADLFNKGLGSSVGEACTISAEIKAMSTTQGVKDYFDAGIRAYDQGDDLESFEYMAKADAGIGIALEQCFTEGTMVATEDGLKPIEEIREGDKVLSFNQETGETEYKAVTSFFIRESSKLYRIEVEGEVIETTSGHPFYVVGKGYVEAAELQVGYELLLHNGEIAAIDNIQIVHLDAPVLVYNMGIEDNHNYFVGGMGVLVHNAGYTKAMDDGIGISESRAKDAGKNDAHGDSGRAKTKAEKRIEELEEQLKDATGNEAKKIRQKIKNIREIADAKKKGETHHRK